MHVTNALMCTVIYVQSQEFSLMYSMSEVVFQIGMSYNLATISPIHTIIYYTLLKME